MRDLWCFLTAFCLSPNLGDFFWLFSAGCCFVICPSREEADKAVDACHNKTTLPGVLFLELKISHLYLFALFKVSLH